jgi:hypothetical protein
MAVTDAADTATPDATVASANGLDIPLEFQSAYADNRAAMMEILASMETKWDGSHPPLLQGMEIDPGDAINSIHAASSAASYETSTVAPFLSAAFGANNIGAHFAKMLIHFPLAQPPDGTGTTFWEWEAKNDCSSFHTGSLTCAQYFYQDPDNVAGHWCGVPNGAGGYYAEQSECGKFLAVWQYIIAQAHTKYGTTIIVQSQVQPKSQSGSSATTVYDLAGFYESLTYGQFNAGRAAQCAFIGTWQKSSAPDYMNVLSEPDTMFEKGAPAETNPAGGDFVQNIQTQLSTILNTMNAEGVPASVTRVIGMGNWEAQLTSPCQGVAEGSYDPPCGILDVELGINNLVTGYPSNPGVKVLDVHMHYNNDCSETGNQCGSNVKNFMTQSLTIVGAISAAGFEVGFDESWPFEYSNAELGQSTTNLSWLEANDAHSFWQPFNQEWMLMLDMLAYRYHATYISFSEPSMYFYNSNADTTATAAKCPCSSLSSCPVSLIVNHVAEGVSADLAGWASGPVPLTPTGTYLKDIVLDPARYVVIDTTSPTTPMHLTGAVEQTGVSMSWGASSDNVGVAYYAIYRGNTLIGHSTSTTYVDSSTQRGGSYTVLAEDANGNQSPISNTFVTGA